MTSPDGENSDDPLLTALAAYDDRLAAGISHTAEDLDQAIDPALLPDWNRLRAFLTLVEKAWPRSGQSLDDPTITDSNRRPELPPTGAAYSSSTAAVDEPASEGGHRFGRFLILGTLGRGGFGIVFLAWDPVLRRQVALKVPQPEAVVTPEARKRFQREAHAAAGLDHPNIVPVYEGGAVDTIAYIAAAYVPGPTLAIWLSRQTRPVPAHDAARLVATLARAVEHAHERGVLHRDLKPSNILLQRQESAPRSDQDELGRLSDFEPRITDFSLAKLADGLGPDTRSGVPFGSPPYMAPEQAEGKLSKIGPTTDVYGLGCILYELLTGKPPFQGETQLDTLRQAIANDPVAPRRVRRDLPVALETVVVKCLQKEPVRRYRIARELAEDLERFLAGESVHARPLGPWEKLRRRAGRHPTALAIVALLVLFAGSILAGRSWFEERLHASRESALLLQAEVRDRELAARRAQYVADIRQVPRDIQDHRTRQADELLARHRPRPGEEDLRGFAWSHLWRRNHTERRTLNGHHGDVYFVEFSRRGDLLASAGKDGTVLIWDTVRWQLVRKILVAQTEVNVAGFSPDGKTIATVDDDGKLKLWEVATGRCRWEKRAHSGNAVVARFSPDGKAVVTGGRNDGRGTVWDCATGSPLAAWQAHARNVENVAFSPDGSCLVTAGFGGIKRWTWPDRELIGTLPESDSVQCAAFSRNGRLLATAHEGDHSVRLWDARGDKLLRRFPGHTDGVFAVAFSADDRTIYSASDDQTIRLWDVATGTERGVHVGHSGRVWNLVLSPDGRSIASAGRDGTVRIWDLEPRQVGRRLPVRVPCDFGFTPDGQTLLVFELEPAWSVSRWHVRSGSLIGRKLLMVTGSPSPSAFSGDGRLLAVANEQATITICDLETDDLQSLRDPALGKVEGLAFSPDASFLLSRKSVPSAVLLVWDLASRHLVTVPWDCTGQACWTPTNEVFAELRQGGFGWLNATTRQTKRITTKPGISVGSLTLSTDARLLAVAPLHSRKIQVLSMDTLALQKEFAGHRDGQSELTLSPDGNTLASAGLDQTVKLWDVATGEELLTLDGFRGPIWSLRFSPDGKALATFSGTGPNKPGEIRLWLAAEAEAEPAPGQMGSTAKGESVKKLRWPRTPLGGARPIANHGAVAAAPESIRRSSVHLTNVRREPCRDF
jgi:eukaryotic-like serine/threonine-protein kinase